MQKTVSFGDRFTFAKFQHFGSFKTLFVDCELDKFFEKNYKDSFSRTFE